MEHEKPQEPVNKSSEVIKKRPKIFYKAISSFVGLPLLVVSLAYGAYRGYYPEPIKQGVNISELVTRLVKTKDAKASFMDMINDSNYDLTTKSWLIHVANQYKDAFEEGGVDEVQEIIDFGIAPEMATVSEIIRNSDENNRNNLILIESGKSRKHKTLVSLIESQEFQDELEKIIGSPSEETTLEQLISQRNETYNMSSELDEKEVEPFIQYVEGVPEDIKDFLLWLLLRSSQVTIFEDNEEIVLESDDYKNIVRAISSFREVHGPDKTKFLINLIRFEGSSDPEFMSENIDQTINRISELYDYFSTSDPVSKAFFIDGAGIPNELTEMLKLIHFDFFNNYRKLEPQPKYKEALIDILKDEQLATVFLTRLMQNPVSEGFVPLNDEMKIRSQLEKLDSVLMIRRHNLKKSEILFLLEDTGTFWSGWSEDDVVTLKANPNLLLMPGSYYFRQDNEENFDMWNTAYKALSKMVPTKLTSLEKGRIFNLFEDVISNSSGLSDEELAQLLDTELLKIGSVKLIELENSFSLEDSQKSNEQTTTLDVPLVLYGSDDSFIAFDESSKTFTSNLASLDGEQIKNDMATFHFLYISHDSLEFGSIKNLLDSAPHLKHIEDVITYLKSQGIQSLTRVLPVFWNGDVPVYEGHVSRIDADEFTAILVVKDSQGKVVRQLATIIPSYELSKFSKSELRNTLQIKNDEEIELLLPDAGYTTNYRVGSISNILTPGSQHSSHQGVRFSIKK